MTTLQTTHRAIRLLLLLPALAATCSMADIILGGPGVPAGTVLSTKIPFKFEYVLPDSYKFVMTGLEAKGDTIGNTGKSDNKQFHLQAVISDTNPSKKVRTDHLYFRDIADFNSSPLKTLLVSPAVTFKASNYPITITIQWSGEGSAQKATGIFNILGEYQKDPPKPVGSLHFDAGDYILADPSVKPSGKATISRD